jgi:16S rRNA (adenine1518-N6/adenine1519-N6)-dimethyltransferase
VPRVVTARRSSAKPKLGQHFLIDPGAAAKIVDALGDSSQHTVLEIGPGRGQITSLLLPRARRVIAIEFDRVLAAQLRMKFATATNLEVIEGDILAVDFHSLFGPKPGSSRPGLAFTPEPVRVVGNLPYYITSDIFLRLFEFRQYFSTMVLMVQREVADRIAAAPGGRDYGLLSATAQLYTQVEKLFTLPPAAFSPPPKVHSSVLRLRVAPRLGELDVPENGFVAFLKQSFGLKRKTLWNNLKGQYDSGKLKAAMEKAGIKPNVRAEALSLEKSAALYRALQAADKGE